ncbi:hypothetical protein SSBR45G_23230 [Bradyrhizobium sp. SSBR45G]|uniref:hypothetical protein n=1 Tax=unclassified Bradyrhizobium TaxID=2631580 RepID=UPI0023429208|nr:MULTISPECIES: hypothetical protein [unclassified Bradyrhizobium]GLH77415.1 hypothetical protein SSBR45G_23230 [Bradyrhizobium sp. SSBR45G]GLH84479.1 hypothetical protein SSBR45R_19390 [Bradyrhizobium sp. SSBR45R]
MKDSLEDTRMSLSGVDQRIEKAVRETMTDQFRSVKVRDVNIKPDTDQFGEDVLHIDVVYDGKSLDPKATTSFVRHLRPRLFELHEMKFPVIYFVSSADL